MVVVRRRLRGVATAWVAREGVRQWWCYDCLSDACRCAMVVVRDVASVVSESEEIYQNCNIYISVHCIYYDLHYFLIISYNNVSLFE